MGGVERVCKGLETVLSLVFRGYVKKSLKQKHP